MTERAKVVIFWSSEDACWIADALDLRFCSAHGETRAQALAELEKALAAWQGAKR